MLTFRQRGTGKTPYGDYSMVRNFCWFYFSSIFPAICKNRVPQIKITATIFPAKIYSRVIIFVLRFATLNTEVKNRVCSITTWLRYFYCTYLTKTKFYQCWVLGTLWKWQKLVPSEKKQSVLISKISSRKTQKWPIRKSKTPAKNFVPHGRQILHHSSWLGNQMVPT